MSTSYPTDLTDEQWELLSVLIPPENPGYGPRCVDLRGVVSAIFYILCAGCAWRMLPHDYPKWQTVYYYFRKWRMDGIAIAIQVRTQTRIVPMTSTRFIWLGLTVMTFGKK